MSLAKVSPYEKLTIIGENGSGKSRLALGYVQHMPSAIVYDPKHEISLKGFVITTDAARLWTGARVIYRPSGEMDPVEVGDILGRAVLDRKNTCLYLDEAALIAPGQRIAPKLRAAIITGRSLKIGIWASTQRPIDVHNLFFSEAHAFFVSPNLIGGDAQKVRGFVRGYAEFTGKHWPKHTFWFYRKGEEKGKAVRAA